ATFLGVPRLDTGRETAAAAPSFEGEAVNPLGGVNRASLPAGSATVRGAAAVVSKSEKVLILRPRSRFTWVWFVPTLLTMGVEVYLVWLVLVGAAGGWAGLQQQGAWLMIVLFGVLSQVSAFLRPLLLYRDHF